MLGAAMFLNALSSMLVKHGGGMSAKEAGNLGKALSEVAAIMIDSSHANARDHRSRR